MVRHDQVTSLGFSLSPWEERHCRTWSCGNPFPPQRYLWQRYKYQRIPRWVTFEQSVLCRSDRGPSLPSEVCRGSYHISCGELYGQVRYARYKYSILWMIRQYTSASTVFWGMATFPQPRARRQEWPWHVSQRRSVSLVQGSNDNGQECDENEMCFRKDQHLCHQRVIGRRLDVVHIGEARTHGKKNSRYHTLVKTERSR